VYQGLPSACVACHQTASSRPSIPTTSRPASPATASPVTRRRYHVGPGPLRSHHLAAARRPHLPGLRRLPHRHRVRRSAIHVRELPPLRLPDGGRPQPRGRHLPPTACCATSPPTSRGIRPPRPHGLPPGWRACRGGVLQLPRLGCLSGAPLRLRLVSPLRLPGCYRPEPRHRSVPTDCVLCHFAADTSWNQGRSITPPSPSGAHARSRARPATRPGCTRGCPRRA